MTDHEVLSSVAVDADADLSRSTPTARMGLRDRARQSTRLSHTRDRDVQATSKPILLRRGEGAYLYDADGTRFIDTVAQNQAISAGYRNPIVYAAVKQQLADMQHCSTMWMHPGPAAFAKALIAKMPPGDWVAHLLSSGSEAVELAILMARVRTQRHAIVALRQAFHGAGGATALAATAISRFHQRVPGASGVVHVTNPDQYRGIHGPGSEPYLDELRASLASSTNGEVAAFMFEPVQGMAA